MKRREFIMAIGGVTLWPLAAWAQQSRNAPRIGFLITGSLELPATRASLKAFHKGLSEYGYIEGQNIFIEVRAADSKVERFPALAREMVGLKVDLIVASNSLAALAAQQATATIPIVVPVMGDPVGDGLVASLARPGGNITGLTFLGPQLVPKRLGLLKEALPSVSHVAVLWHPAAYGEHTMKSMMNEAEDAARALGVHLRFVAARGPDELQPAFSAIGAARADALLVFPSPMLFTERKRIVDLATQHRLPLMAMGKEFVQLGGFMSYGADITDFNRRCVFYVDKILKGARPADLPVEQATKFELFINLKTAQLLGIEIPPSLLARADEVIE
ncbi:ABC transporter substrate-binding protein [Bradyrhizobium sp. AUGA SZCCT0431]|uniref:ABC transporter substrate-binding protein n=1 Tax=Bradyrhizobium sp. AUGA SZCCT0431 TaxID=2807674 RepID=UPI001BA65D07|nr:ABC transporter substrate-binding protein [Bradyrhizobium sp. AUGA SZCCT0431]MBR1142968.1 ABC transporter substrate-binding protein [Bradyrhizobium sp. AUGA SZCCT0431]